MKKMILTALPTALIALSVSATAATLNDGDVLIKAGSVTVSPNVDSSTPMLGDTSLWGIANGLGIASDTQLGLSATLMLNSNWGVELLAATPFEHELTIDGGAVDGTKVGTTKHLPPTLSLAYYPLGESNSKWQPYIGAGLNFTTFFSEEVDQEFIATLNTLDLGLESGNLNIKDSWGLAAQVGVDYFLTDRWFINASAMYADIKADATIDFAPQGQIKVSADVDPWVYRFNIGYRF